LYQKQKSYFANGRPDRQCPLIPSKVFETHFLEVYFESIFLVILVVGTLGAKITEKENPNVSHLKKSPECNGRNAMDYHGPPSFAQEPR
jgi:hypothetical protein